MTTLPIQRQGVLNINNLQGNSRTIALTLNMRSSPESNMEPIDLRFWDVAMEIKTSNNPNQKPFRRLTVGNGLQVMGAEHNVLVFELSKEFWDSVRTSFLYDIVFLSSTNKAFTFVTGVINQKLTNTKPTT